NQRQLIANRTAVRPNVLQTGYRARPPVAGRGGLVATDFGASDAETTGKDILL
ncbi:MAG: hypothetical protein A07HR67_00854, partial [uncultured archaeon A07HR67]